MVFLFLVALVSLTLRADDAPSFTRDVAPILVEHCVACHGVKNPGGEYRLNTWNNAAKPGESEAAPFVPSKPDESEWLRLLTHADPNERMPKDRPALSPDVIAVVRRWIAAGAKYDHTDPDALLTTIAATPWIVTPEFYARPIPIRALSVRSSSNGVLFGGYGEILERELEHGTLVRRRAVPIRRVTGLALSPDERTLIVAGGDPGVRGLVVALEIDASESRIASGDDIARVAVATELFFDVAWSPDGKRLAAVGGDRTLRVWNVVRDGERLKFEQTLRIEAHADWATTVRWSPDGTKLLTTGRDLTARLFDASNGKLLANFTNHESAPSAAIFANDPDSIFSVDSRGERKIQEWLAKTGQKITPKKPDEKNQADQEKHPRDYRASPFGKGHADVSVLLLVDGNPVAATKNRLVWFNEDSRATIRTFAGGEGNILTVVYQPEKKRVLAADDRGVIYVWSTEKNESIMNFHALPTAP